MVILVNNACLLLSEDELNPLKGLWSSENWPSLGSPWSPETELQLGIGDIGCARHSGDAPERLFPMQKIDDLAQGALLRGFWSVSTDCHR